MADAWRVALEQERGLIDKVLRAELKSVRRIPERLRRAMAHSLFSGGKRLRPILALWTYDALGDLGRGHRHAVDRDAVLRVSAAIEMIHTYSLIHDDLPAMDDDVLRRGRPTCHVAFNEGTAILAGDGLQALAFSVLATVGPRAAELVSLAAHAAGPAGMVGGQQLDLDAEGQPATSTLVRKIHAGKTAAMISLSLAAAGVCRDADGEMIERLKKAGSDLGLAFQGADDLLDVTASPDKLGKTPGKDAASEKATWVRVEGFEAAQRRTQRLGRRGRRELSGMLPTNSASQKLLELADYMWQRDH